MLIHALVRRLERHRNQRAKRVRNCRLLSCARYELTINIITHQGHAEIFEITVAGYIVIYFDHGVSWIIMNYHGLSGNIMHYHGLSEIIMDYHGLRWIIMDYPRLSWIIRDCHGLSWAIVGYHGLSWIIMDYQ